MISQGKSSINPFFFAFKGKRFFYILFFLWIHAFHTTAQRQNDFWYFGNSAGIKFTSSGQQILTGSPMLANEACVSIADRNSGRLIFMSNGVQVWDSLFQPMPNGQGLMGGFSPGPTSRQGIAVIPHPALTQTYFLLTTDARASNRGLRYSTLNMLLNGGKGDIDINNKNVLIQANASEKLATAAHASLNAYWVIAHDTSGNRYSAWKLDSIGQFSSAAVQSSTGSPIQVGSGGMRFNHRQDRLAHAIGNQSVDILRFDRSNGSLSFEYSLNTLTTDTANSLEFSPDGRFLYVACQSSGLLQFDLQAGSPADVQASRFLVTSQPSKFVQRGPDCKLYILGNQVNALLSPNLPGNACQFTPNYVAVNPSKLTKAFPTPLLFADESFRKPIILQFDSCKSNANSFALSSVPAGIGFRWDFGDPNSGANNLVNGPYVSHIFTDTGLFTVTCYLNYGCDYDTIRGQFRVINCNPNQVQNCKARISILDTCLEANIPFVLQSDSVLLGALWNFGDPNSGTNNTGNGLSTAHKFSSAGTYIVTALVDLACGRDTVRLTLNINSCIPPRQDTLPCSWFLPSVFSPNNDGLNDQFLPLGACQQHPYQIEIWNIWGQSLYKFSGLPAQDTGWDGTQNKETCSSGLYNWHLEWESEPGNWLSKSGKVWLMR